MMARAGFECGPAAVAGRNGVVEVIAPKADHAAIAVISVVTGKCSAMPTSLIPAAS